MRQARLVTPTAELIAETGDGEGASLLALQKELQSRDTFQVRYAVRTGQIVFDWMKQRSPAPLARHERPYLLASQEGRVGTGTFTAH